MAKKDNRDNSLSAKVIIIDDDRKNAALLKVWLELKGHRCFVVKRLEEAAAKSNMAHLVGIFYASEFRFEFLYGKLEGYHIYEDAEGARHARMNSRALVS